MAKINSLRDIIQFNSNFKTAINLYLSLNKAEKVLGYIPTKSSVSFLGEYLKAVLENKEQATLLVGPYGKGKSHLLLVLLAVLSMKKTPESESAINELIDNVSKTDEVGERVSEYIGQVWDKKRFLPVLITDTTGDLNQAFLYGLNDALKRDGLLDLAPETYYSIALDRIDDWEQNYFETYKMFERELTQNGMSIAELKTDLKQYSQKTLILFKEIYPKVTAGSEFNPMALADALPLYKSVSEKLVDEYGYSGIYIVFDEFSKFIEGQNNIAAGTNMHLLQSMCELATDSKNAQVFITMVAHKSIKEYGKYLSRDLINLFTGIEGRIIEKYFVTSSKNNYELIKNAIVKDDSKLLNIPHYEKYLGKEKFKEFYSLPAFRSGFDETEFKNVIFNGCYPLNPIAAYLLLNISEKVAQNERTLFTFISNDEPHSMARFVSEHTLDKEWSIGADLIYEYFSALFKKDVVNEFIHNIWLSAEYAIDKCDTEDQRKIVKALAVILIVNKEDEIPATEKYLKLCINASDPEQALMELKKKEFIYKKNSTDSYVFKTRAGSELKAEIKRQRELKGENVNYSKVLLDVTGNYFIIPRKYNTVKMMTRYFTNEFMSVDDFLNITSSTALLDNTLDGKVITLYSFSRIKQEAVKQHLLELAEKRLVVICPKKGLKAKKQLKDYEIISDLKGNQVFTNNNEILKRELPLLLDDLTTELEIIIGDVYEDDLDTKVLYFDGGRIKNAKSGNVEKAVNECCLNVYTSTPIINNEMVNRAEIGTAQTKKARLNIVQAILSHTDTPEFYRGSNQEATIYRSLFCVTGIVDGDIREDIQLVIDEINRYIDSCCDKKVSVKGMVYKLVKAPYGMRAGVIPFYLAYVLANRREDIIVYFSNKEVQITSDIVVNMCEQPEDYAVYVSKEDLQKEKYISELNMLFEVDDNWNLSSNRIKDIIICMQRWFRSLQQATRNVIYLDQYVDNDNMVQAMKTMKKAMQKVEFNPFEILFVEFPEAFGTESLGASTRKARKGMGRFGVGLPQASLYACPEIEVYSWQTGVENAHKVYLDINKIKDGEQKEIEDPALTQIPDPYASYLHYQTLSEKYDFSKSGTLVIWKKCDRISPKTRGPLTERLEFSLGQKFRYFIHDGVSKIKIVCDENPDVAVDVAPNDPLFLMEDNCVLCHQDDPKKVFKPGEANGIEAPFELYTAKGDATGEVQIPIKYIDKNGNKAESSVLVRFSIVKNKFYDETAFPKGINPGNYALGKHAAKMEGISVVRARREIDFRRFDYYNVVNEPQHRWWGCEIIFTPELDEAFGVANNKQYVELKKVDVEDLDPDEVDMPKKGEHSREAKELVTEIIARLEDIPDGCAECFPFELIDELKQEYLTDNSL